MKASSYLTLVCPIMEYVWDPYQLNNIQALEKVQRRAARWVMKVCYVTKAKLACTPTLMQDYKHSIKLYTTYQHCLFHLTSYQHKDLPDTTTHSTTSFPVQELAPISTLLPKNN